MRAVAVGAHAAGVRSRVAVADRLVILRGFERQRGPAVAQDDEADFFSGEEFLDDQQRPERVEGRSASRALLRDDHALAGRESVRFDYYGKVEPGERGKALLNVSTCRNAAVGYASSPSRSPWRRSCCLRAGRWRRRADDARPGARNSSTMPATSGASGPTTVRSVSTAAATASIIGWQWGRTRATCAMPGLPGAAKTRDLPELREFPRQGMLAAAAADDQNLHGKPCSTMVTMHGRSRVIRGSGGGGGARRMRGRPGLRPDRAARPPWSR